MKPAWPEQTQDTHEHDYIALCVSNLKKYTQMKFFPTFACKKFDLYFYFAYLA